MLSVVSLPCHEKDERDAMENMGFLRREYGMV